MANNVKNYDSEFKKLSILMYIIMALLLIICILSFMSACGVKENKPKYDVSMMREVGVSDALELFDTNDTYVLYIGRETCDICEDLLPTLQKAQKNNNYITQYLDISKADRTTDDWKKLMELLDVETTTTMEEDDKVGGEVVTESFGYFINAKGFTPAVLIISKGKNVAGFFGDKDIIALEDWLANYGI